MITSQLQELKILKILGAGLLASMSMHQWFNVAHGQVAAYGYGLQVFLNGGGLLLSAVLLLGYVVYHGLHSAGKPEGRNVTFAGVLQVFTLSATIVISGTATLAYWVH